MKNINNWDTSTAVSNEEKYLAKEHVFLGRSLGRTMTVIDVRRGKM